jgi:hypothetical protein
LLVSLEFIGRLTNNNISIYRVNVDDDIESMQSKSIKFMSPLKSVLRKEWEENGTLRINRKDGIKTT